MSLATLRKSLVPETQLELPSLVALAKARGKNVTLFDVETTTFMGNPQFAIIEIAMLHINQKGQLGWTSALVNPEMPVTPATSRKTGIYTDDVMHADTWASAWAEAMVHVADKHIVIGFNCIEAACPAVQDQNARYGMPSVVFQDVIDVRSLWQVVQKGKKGSLADLAAYFSVPVDETHRAQADVSTAARILDKMVALYGPGLLSHPQRTWSSKTGAPSVFTSPEDIAGLLPMAQTPKAVETNDAVELARAVVRDAVARSATMQEFVMAVEETFPVRVTVGHNKVHGYWLNVNGHKVKGSHIGEAFTWSALVKEQGLEFEPKTDMAYFKTKAESLFGDTVVAPSMYSSPTP